MPTPSELQNDRPRRSVFGNYRAVTPPREDPVTASETVRSPRDTHSLQVSINSAVARTFLHGFLARALADPDPEHWRWLMSRSVLDALRSSATALDHKPLRAAAEELSRELASARYEEFLETYYACFGHSARGECPMNEIEYGDIRADPLFQPHRLADIGAFLAAFGLELTADAGERVDHISVELEFMSVLSAREAYALEHQWDDDALAVLRDARKKFLREHLGRWSPAFSRRLARMAEGTVPGAVAKLLGEFIRFECALVNIAPGSEDLLLRPVDDSIERLCDQCGIRGLPPGAAISGAKL